ncbi:site-2 protease family protein [Leucobacter allii]|uniref:Site-2 protease family protein n=1 Tax=Leucobacter allii TaxID=2932247 RepID=A0ABY4FIE1_9MICO|nr:site-2 protease family protein [Leucobacter allii]UOQ56165.1 site-2 protease family protein [Leucobacter allii]
MTEVLLYILGILIVVVGLAVSIGLHEIGHLVPAKLFGVKVTQYMVGFGKTIWSRRTGETEYGVKLIPLGGYVAMIGMYPPQKPGEAARASTTGFFNSVLDEGTTAVKSAARGAAGGRLDEEIERIGDGPAPRPADGEAPRGLAGIVDDARLASAETIGDDDARTFYRLPVWKKIVVMLGGPFMNLLLAGVFFTIVLVGFGLPQNSTTLGQLSECLRPASSSATDCGADAPAAPAAAAGLLPGDRIVAVDGDAIADWDAFRAAVAQSPGRALDVVIERDGAERSVELTPVANERLVTDADGEIVTGADGEPLTETVGMVGATPATETVPQPISAVPAYVGENISNVAGVIVGLPQRMVDIWNAAFGAEERDPNGPISVVGVGRLAGEVASLDAPVAAKAQTMFGLLGSLNVALFVFNLVPLMPLDGGHVVGALYEGLKRGIARLRGKRDPGPVDTAKMVPVTLAVSLVLGAMTVLLVYADIVKPVSLFG